MSPSGKEELIPAEVVVCRKCSKVPKFFFEAAKGIPEDLKSTCHLLSSTDKGIILDK